MNKRKDLLEDLRKLDIEVQLLTVNPFSFVICDDKIIWYGDLKFFMNNKNDSMTLRLSNREIAEKMRTQYGV